MPQFKDIMIDLETLATGARAHIIQIAAIAFDRETGEFGPRFVAYVRGAQPGRTIDPDTVAWWLTQTKAREMGACLQTPTLTRELPQALAELQAWYHQQWVHNKGESLAVWSHGATFDIPILADAFVYSAGVAAPWHYRATRDTRTLYDLAPGGMPELPKDAAREHDAEYDCEYQIAQVCAALRALRGVAADALEVARAAEIPPTERA